MRSIKLLAFLFLFGITAYAQTAPQAGLVDIKQAFKKLNILGSVLYVAAHPDDENTRLLAYLAQEKHYRTGYLSLTRGDGGQNLIGNEQGELLGLIRTQELLAARHIDGAEQFFTRANDFGFSKGPDETLKIWDREAVLGDVVWVIRKFKPDVIICRWPTTGEGGHGHHTASAILAQEAFTAAADPKRFPEQLQFVQPWQAKRLLFNSFNFGSVNTSAENQFKLDVGVYNPVLGKGYGEIAAESRSQHKSQGMGTAKERGEAIEYFKTILGDAPHTDLMDGVNTTWKRIGNTEGLDANINIIAKQFDENTPAASVPGLVKVLSRVEKLNDTYWREQKTKELKNLIAACAGLWFEAYTAEPTYAIGDTMNVKAQLIDRYDTGYKINRIYSGAALQAIPVYQNTISYMAGASLDIQRLIPANQLQTFNLKDGAAKITQPYWLEKPRTLGSYVIGNQLLVGDPENSDLPKVTFEFIIEGKPIQFERRLVYKSVDPVRGEVYRNVEIAPPVTANIDNSVYIFKDVSSQKIAVKLKSFTQTSGSVALKAPAGWKIMPEQIAFNGKKKGEEWTETFTVWPLDNQQRNDVLKVITTVNGTEYQMGLKRMAYNHIPTITVFPPAQTKLLKLNIQTPGKTIGYIVGAGDLVPDALRQLGYKVVLLSEEDVMKGDLSVYDAIVTGVRAYNVNDRMAVEQPKLLNYVKNGGNLVIQYNNNAGLVTTDIGPYPFRVINQRITDEDAKVTILDAQSPLLNYPNKITQADFDGWVQERSIYHVDKIDPNYKTIFQMNDPNEASNNGSLITTDYGKGRFIYTSLVFFRELPAGVPGAYRLFINLLTKPAN
ncbi:LmbE family N-acetylglucosaminyl deacetylase [Mucilaginibacter gracilis]|uniref:LmbE family N-acetylglucosaminyl deacetylase n=1 Tax=Mucilaginibacter gracilis TaxID=423350 RepID=A0A495IXH6_9SPHI|nr:PIG-L family deacetylase [Mucilaginibacter gracilis]RKR81091.1 LmbE family N-acetylglucosaminyl deacetylase [Mucilaginibacter gracilis]